MRITKIHFFNVFDDEKFDTKKFLLRVEEIITKQMEEIELLKQENDKKQQKIEKMQKKLKNEPSKHEELPNHEETTQKTRTT